MVAIDFDWLWLLPIIGQTVPQLGGIAANIAANTIRSTCAITSTTAKRRLIDVPYAVLRTVTNFVTYFIPSSIATIVKTIIKTSKTLRLKVFGSEQ